MKKIGYARVSSSDQNLDRQIAALRAEGCDEIYREKMSGKSVRNRPELEKAIDHLGTGDKVVVAEWDRATRSMIDGIDIIKRINDRGSLLKVLDKEGRDTTDPQDMIDGSAQLPLGSEREMGGHKGYSLASMVDILCCVLSGANWGPFAPPFALGHEIPARSVGKGIGHFFGALQIDGFIDKDEFKKQIDDWIQVCRNAKPAPGTNGPLIPGDPEREAEAIRSKDGIPLLKTVVDDLLDISRKTGIPFSATPSAA